MNSTETMLSERYRRTGYRLYKYYNNDEIRTEGIPDILDLINAKLGNAYDKYDRMRMDYAKQVRDKSKSVSHYDIDEQKNLIGNLESTLRYIEDTLAEYYLYNGHNITAISERETDICRIMANGDGTLSFRRTGDKIRIWRPECPIAIVTYDIVVSDDTVVHIDNISPSDINGLYAFTRIDVDSFRVYLPDNRRVCIDCGKIFEINDGERKFYETNGLMLPKRCPACRAKRREKKGTYFDKKGKQDV